MTSQSFPESHNSSKKRDLAIQAFERILRLLNQNTQSMRFQQQDNTGVYLKPKLILLDLDNHHPLKNRFSDNINSGI
jgi:hypothetical protein